MKKISIKTTTETTTNHSNAFFQIFRTDFKYSERRLFLRIVEGHNLRRIQCAVVDAEVGDETIKTITVLVSSDVNRDSEIWRDTHCPKRRNRRCRIHIHRDRGCLEITVYDDCKKMPHIRTSDRYLSGLKRRTTALRSKICEKTIIDSRECPKLAAALSLGMLHIMVDKMTRKRYRTTQR